jgi:hypothetical protein
MLQLPKGPGREGVNMKSGGLVAHRLGWVNLLFLTSVLVTFLLAGNGLCRAQVTSGTILGAVVDPSGAAVANAKVTITATETNVQTNLVSTSEGNFEAPYLAAGEYAVAVSAPGFKAFRQTGIALNTDAKYRVDVKLEVGSTNETVTVAASVEVLQTDASELAHTVDHQAVASLPNINGNPLVYATIMAGVVPTGALLDPNNVNSGNAGRQNFSSFVVNGSRPISSNIQLDGAMNTSPMVNEIAVLPSLDAIGDVRVITNAYSAEYGRAGGGVINFTTKSGTNQVHGSLYENFRNSAMNANSFGNNTFGRNSDGTPVRPKVPFNTNDFGGTFSGPIWLPKIYNGHNKSFFFVSYEGLRRAMGASAYYTVPTAAERTGDFSKTVAQVTAPNGGTQVVPVNIYLPLPSTTTVTQVANGQYQLNRQQATYGAVANVIAPQYINSTASKLMNLYPLPNITPVNADGSMNYFTNATAYTRTDQLVVKLDHNFNDMQKGFFRWTTDWTLNNPANIYGANAAANNNGPMSQFNPSATLGYDWAISPTSVLELRANVTRINLISQPYGGLNQDLASLGFSPAELKALPSANALPNIGIGSYPRLGIGSFVMCNDHSTDYSFTPNYTKIFNKWTVKFGGEYMILQYNYLQPYQAAMAFNALGTGFSTACSGTGCATLPYNVVQGSAAANFLVGGADGYSNGQYASNEPAMALQNKFYSVYNQNDWRATRNLTVNLGIRYEYQAPMTERYNRLSQFDLNATNITGTAGQYQFAGLNGLSRGQTNSSGKNFAPRIGFAYRLGNKTVIRSAYGISYDMITGVGAGAQGFGSDGFSAPSFVQIRPQSGLDILQNPFNNAFSSGGTIAAGNSQNPLLLGNSVTAIVRNDSAIPYSQQWNFTIQRQLPGGLNLQVAYVGTKGTHLSIQQQPVNQTDDIPQSTLTSALNTYVQTGINPLTTYVTNPMYGTVTTNSNLKNPTIQQQYLDLPYPAYGGVTRFQDRTGSSTYHSLQVTVQHAFQHGFQAMGSYTWSKSMDYGGSYAAAIQTGSSQGNMFWDPNDRSLDRSVSAFDQPQRFVLSFVAESPFGKGKKYFNHTPVVSQALTGWKLSGIGTFAAGFPMGITGGGFGRPNLVGDPVLPDKYRATGDGHTAFPLPDGKTIVLPVGYKLYFNPDAFSVPVLTVPKAGSTGTVNVANPYYYGTSPRLFSDLRAPGVNNWDLNLSRAIDLHERLKLEIRADAYNAFNRVQMGSPTVAFGGPNLTTAGAIGTNTSTSFGTINTATIQTAVGQNTNSPRYMQLSMRLTF